MLEYRQHDEIQEFCAVLNHICNTKFINRFEVDSAELLRELNPKIRKQSQWQSQLQ